MSGRLTMINYSIINKFKTKDNKQRFTVEYADRGLVKYAILSSDKDIPKQLAEIKKRKSLAKIAEQEKIIKEHEAKQSKQKQIDTEAKKRVYTHELTLSKNLVKNLLTVQLGKFSNFNQAYVFPANPNFKDLPLFKKQNNIKVLAGLYLAIDKFKGIKVAVTLKCLMMKKAGKETIYEMKYFSSSGSNVENAYAMINKRLCKIGFDILWARVVQTFEKFLQNGSGWTLSRIDRLYVNIVEYKPVGGSSYIQLPKFIADKKCCNNVQNNENQGFKYTILSALKEMEEKEDKKRGSK